MGPRGMKPAEALQLAGHCGPWARKASLAAALREDLMRCQLIEHEK